MHILLRLARAHAILRKFLVYVAEQPQVDRRFGRHPMPGAARPWFERAVTGGKEEIAVYDDMVGRFGTAGEPALREEVANASGQRLHHFTTF